MCSSDSTHGVHYPAQIDAGKLLVAHKVEVGYLAQTAVSGSESTVWQEARSQMTRLLKAEADMALAEVRLAAGESEEGGQLMSTGAQWEGCRY